MPTSDSTDVAAGFPRGLHVRRSADGIVLAFPVLRAPGVSLSLAVFGLLCLLMPAAGLSALLPLQSADAMQLVTLALIGGLAAPFALAGVVFLALAIYLAANSLLVEIDASGIRTERRIFGRLTRLRDIARDDIAAVEPRISARYQNVFSATPRYALIACHRGGRARDVVIAEDLAGQPLMQEINQLVCAALDIK